MFDAFRSRFMKSLDSEQFTYAQLKSMFLTLVLDQFFIVFINVLSTAMVSSTGEAAIAAANMVGTVNGMVALLFTAVAIGGSIVIARAKGRGNAHGVRCAIGETIALCGAISIALSSLLIVFARPLVNTLYPHAEPLLIQYSIHYMRLIAISFLPYSVFNAVFNAFRSLGDTKSSLMLTIVINGVHFVCSFLFINIFGLGITGAGLSYITARIIGMALALVWLMKIHNEYHVGMRHLFHFSRTISREISKLAIPIASESALFQGGMLLVQVFLARLTTTELAAHGVATSVMNLYLCTGNALTALTSTVGGQCIGAAHYELARRYCVALTRAGRLVMLLTVLILTPLLPLLLSLYHPSAAAMPIIYTCLTVASVGIPLIWCSAYVPPMALRAAGDASFSTVVSVIALFAGRIAVGYVLTITLGLGVPGVWLGMMIEWLLRALMFHLRVRSDGWLKRAGA